MVLLSKEDEGSDNVQVIRDELVIEVCKTQERAHSLDRGRGVPVLDGREFHGIHMDDALSNDHLQVLHGAGIKRALGDLEQQTVVP